MSATNDSTLSRTYVEGRIWQVLQGVPDPEIPALSVVDLGIVRYARMENEGVVRVGISPTYSGCPATAFIKENIVQALRKAGFENIATDEVLAPAWTSDWITVEGRRKLREYGIAPPAEAVSSPRDILRAAPVVHCPRCNSAETNKLSEFGSTPCKALYRCNSCLEPFDYFKCH